MGQLISFLKIYLPKFFLYLLCSILFILLLFPYQDLSGFVSKQIAKATNNQVFVQFDDLGLSLLPLGLSLENLKMTSGTLPEIIAQKVDVSPSIAKLLARSYGGSVFIEGIMDSRISASLSLEENQEENQNLIKISDLELSNVNLEQLKDFAPNLPMQLVGSLDADLSDVVLEQSLKIPPSGEFQTRTEKLEINAPTLNVPSLGALSLPDLNFSQTLIKGRLIDGQLNLDDVFFGNNKDLLQINTKGSLNLTLQKAGQQLMTQFGSYDLKIKMLVSDKLDADYKSLLSTLNLFLKIDSFKSQKAKQGFTEYVFRIQGSSFRTAPRTSKTTF